MLGLCWQAEESCLDSLGTAAHELVPITGPHAAIPQLILSLPLYDAERQMLPVDLTSLVWSAIALLLCKLRAAQLLTPVFARTHHLGPCVLRMWDQSLHHLSPMALTPALDLLAQVLKGS